MNIEQRLIKLEKKLLDPSLRKSREALDKLIADDFAEIGKSGSRYSKQDVLEHVTQEVDRKIESYGWEVRQIDEKVYIINYISFETVDGQRLDTLRTSLWKLNGDNWQMIFHQGTNKNQ